MITLTDSAKERVRDLLAKDPVKSGLRVQVVGGGCGGLEYKLDLTEGPGKGDKVFDGDGFQVYVDMKSYLFVANSVLDWREDLMGTSFKFDNPQATGTCGCGESFYVDK